MLISTILFIFLFACAPPKSNTEVNTSPIKEQEELSNWNATDNKKEIINFIEKVSNPSSSQFVPVKDRIAVIDMDGTLWCEKPFYFQYQFIVDRMRYLVPQHPEWKKDELLNGILNNNLDIVRKYGWEGLMEAVVLTHTGMTVEKHEELILNWIEETKHPKTGYAYKEMVYLPMIEMIRYLKSKQFSVFVVTEGGASFLRPWAEKVLELPNNQIIGSHLKLVYKETSKDTFLFREPEILFVSDGPNKPVAIHRFIGKKPILAFGNSDNDIPMFDYCRSNEYPNMQVIIHHTDSVREYAYGAQSFVGQLNIALRLAPEKDWVIVDMQKDWGKIFDRD